MPSELELQPTRVAQRSRTRSGRRSHLEHVKLTWPYWRMGCNLLGCAAARMGAVQTSATGRAVEALNS